MKTPFRFLQMALLLIAAAGFYACEKNSENAGQGTAEFSISVAGEKLQLKSGNMLDSVNVSFNIMVSVEDMDGKPVLTDKLIPLYVFGPGFVSEKIELGSGEYRLTKFMVINAAGEVVYAAPLVGSPLAYLVSRPLPITFSIIADRITQVTPEVLAVANQDPGKFGYATFPAIHRCKIDCICSRRMALFIPPEAGGEPADHKRRI